MFSRFLPSTSVKDICCYPVVFKDKLYSYRLKNKTSRLYRTQSPQQPRLPIRKHVAFFEEQGYKSTIKKQKFMLAWSSFWLAKCQDTFGSDFRSSQDKKQAGQCFNIVLGAPKPFTITSLGGSSSQLLKFISLIKRIQLDTSDTYFNLPGWCSGSWHVSSSAFSFLIRRFKYLERTC